MSDKKLRPGFRQHLFSCRNGLKDDAPCCEPEAPEGFIKCNWCGDYHDGSMTFGGTPILACPEVPNDGNLHSIDVASFAKAYGKVYDKGLADLIPIQQEINGFVDHYKKRFDEHLFGDGDGSAPIYERIDDGSALKVNIIEVWTCYNHPPGSEIEVKKGEACYCGETE